MLTTNQILDETYMVLQEIGRGGTGTVFLAYHKRLEKYVVLKRIRSTGPYQDWRKEVDILKNLHHPCLPQVYDYLQETDAVYTVMDYVEGDTLAEYIKAGWRFPEQNVSLWLGQMADVIAYLHTQTPPILHCDIKPENIIITPEGNAVLIDFNVSMAYRYDDLVGISPAYASPEQMQLAKEVAAGMAPDLELDGRTDIYSLAASFYSLMSGKTPSAYFRVQPLSEMDLGYSESLTELIDGAMEPDRDKRPPDAKRFSLAVMRLRRREAGLWVILALRVVTLLLSGILIAAGIYCLVAGKKTATAEAYAAQISSVLTDRSSADAEQTEAQCWQILNDPEFRSLLDERPSDKAKLYAVMGDLDYADERLRSAADLYEQAALAAPQDEQSGYWRNAIICLAESGDPDRAEDLWTRVKGRMSDADSHYVAAILYAKQKNAQTCIEHVKALLEMPADRQMYAKAAIAAASVSTDVQTELDWLRKAEQYGGGKTAERALAAAYANLARTGDAQTARTAEQTALSLYRKLAEDLYASRADRLNYAIVLRMAGQPVRGLQVLEQMLPEYPNDYRVLAQLAFACFEANLPEKARDYCQRALTAWSSDLSAEREDAESQTVSDLRALKDRLG